jgi:hypothetical protein
MLRNYGKNQRKTTPKKIIRLNWVYKIQKQSKKNYLGLKRSTKDTQNSQMKLIPIKIQLKNRTNSWIH